MSNLKLRSWSLADWPADVWPNSENRARRVLRFHRKELMSCGALSRVGRELIIFAEPYIKWVKSKAANVGEYKVEINERRKIATAEESAA